MLMDVAKLILPFWLIKLLESIYNGIGMVFGVDNSAPNRRDIVER